MSQAPVWFITAASSGFGKYIALEAVSRGHTVVASARNTDRIADIKKAGADTVALDVTWPLPEIEKVAKEVNEKYGRINYLVNAAGYILEGAVEETSPEEDYNTFKTNVLGTINVCKAFLPYIRATSGGRCIANFGSIASWYGGPGYGLYNATKWAVSGLSEGLHAELAPLGVAVTVVEPGYFRTGFLNPTAKVSSKKTIQAYEDTAVGAVRRRLKATDNNQPGDPAKGARVVVDIMTKSGSAEGREIPIRIALGSDSPTAIRKKLTDTEELLKAWEGVTTVTDHE